jgi:cell division transport system permease protein
MQVYLHDGPNPNELKALEYRIRSLPYVAESQYVSKEVAAARFLQGTTEDVVELMGGVNPLPASISIRLRPEYLQNDSLKAIQNRLENEYLVAEVEYPLETFNALQSNVQVITWVSALLGFMLLGVALLLVMQTVRSGIYARRLSIRSMQLVGASPGFVRKPFVERGLIQGALAGLLSASGLWLVGFFIDKRIPQISFQGGVATAGEFFALLGGIGVIGIVLGGFASTWAVNRYLTRNLDEII